MTTYQLLLEVVYQLSIFGDSASVYLSQLVRMFVMNSVIFKVGETNSQTIITKSVALFLFSWWFYYQFLRKRRRIKALAKLALSHDAPPVRLNIRGKPRGVAYV